MHPEIMKFAWQWARDTFHDNEAENDSIADYFPYCLNETIEMWEGMNARQRRRVFG